MIVALVGPPGSGKTHLAHLLASKLGYSYTEIEQELLDRASGSSGWKLPPVPHRS